MNHIKKKLSPCMLSTSGHLALVLFSDHLSTSSTTRESPASIPSELHQAWNLLPELRPSRLQSSELELLEVTIRRTGQSSGVAAVRSQGSLQLARVVLRFEAGLQPTCRRRPA